MRGYFQHLTAAQRVECAKKGGRASPMKWTSETAREAGRKGGKVSGGKWITQHPGGPEARRKKPKRIVDRERARAVLSRRFWMPALPEAS